MSREDGMEASRAVTTPERSALRRLTKREIDRRIAAISLEVTRAFDGVDGERVEYLGEEIFPRPMDTRKFIRIMSRYMVFN